MSACHVELQYWKHWPKILVMHDDNGNERVYIPEPECETDMTGLPTRVRLDGFWYALEETCHNAAPEYLDFLCSECGFVHYHSDENDDGDGNDWNYCPQCGAKVGR